jgi:flagellar motility protein MotE (MotC chaperone)
MNHRVVAFLAICPAILVSPGLAEQQSQEKPQQQKQESVVVPEDFCSSFIDLATERRHARLNQELQRSRDLLAETILELDAKSEELKSLIATRKSMQDKVRDSILKIYLEVEPESAALQLARLEPSTAAEILVRMNAKRSGEILSLMEPKLAASLVALLTLQAQTEKVSSP